MKRTSTEEIKVTGYCLRLSPKAFVWKNADDDKELRKLLKEDKPAIYYMDEVEMKKQNVPV